MQMVIWDDVVVAIQSNVKGGWASNAFEQHLIGITMTGKSNQVNLWF